MGSQKGGQYEREICRQLSMWYSKGKSDDYFWRSSQSGGRATQRAKKGKKTYGHAGDITYTNPKGQSFIKLVTVEIKRGYSSKSIADLFDKHPRMKQQTIEAFIQQTTEAKRRAGTPFSMLIHRRDKRQPLVYMDYDLIDFLTDEQSIKFKNYVLVSYEFADTNFKNTGKKRRRVGIVQLEEFLTLDPDIFKKYAKEISSGY